MPHYRLNIDFTTFYFIWSFLWHLHRLNKKVEQDLYSQWCAMCSLCTSCIWTHERKLEDLSNLKTLAASFKYNIPQICFLLSISQIYYALTYRFSKQHLSNTTSSAAEELNTSISVKRAHFQISFSTYLICFDFLYKHFSILLDLSLIIPDLSI